MSEEHKHMDDCFRKMSEEFEATYHKSFWDEARTKLENDSLDNAFREAAAGYMPVSGMALASGLLGDAFMDDAFCEAAKQAEVVYDKAFWNEMEANHADLQMDEAFHAASKETRANYRPVYWGAANTALEEEGLHYEYNSSYWNEARDLLDKADRRAFFTKWTGAAAVLLLISFIGLNTDFSAYTNTLRANRQEFSMPNEKSALNENMALINSDNVESAPLHDLIAAEETDVPNEGQSTENSINLAVVENVVDDNTAVNSTGNNDVSNTVEMDPNSTVDHTETETQTGNSEVSLNQNAYRNELNTESTQETENRNYTNPLTDEGSVLQLANSNLNSFEPTLENKEDRHAGKVLNTNMNPIAVDLSPIAYNGVAMPLAGLMEITPVKRKPVHVISAIGGIGAGNSFGGEPLTLTRRFYAGVEYTRQGHGRLRNFEFGGSLTIRYSKHDDFGMDSLTIVHQDNGTVERNWKKIQIHDLYYANGSLLVNYRLNPKNKIKFGVGMDYLLANQHNVASRLGREEDIATINNNWMEIGGLKKHDFSFSLGYEYRLTRKFGVQLNVNYGLFDRSEDVSFGEESGFDNEINGTIGLKYNLFTRVK